MLLTRDSEHPATRCYIEDKHPLLLPYLPPDTEASDLFERVQHKKDLSVFFRKPGEDADPHEVARAFARLEGAIEILLEEEAQINKLKNRKEKLAEQQQKRKAKKQKREPQGPPPKPPTMDFEESVAAKVLAEAKKEEQRRAALLENGFTIRAGVGPKDSAGDHISFFWKDPKEAIKLLGEGFELKQATRAYGVVLKLDGKALETFEQIKRAGNPNAKGKDRLKHKDFKLPTDGRPPLDTCTSRESNPSQTGQTHSS